MAVPKRIRDRISAGLKRFRGVLEAARSADRSEQDTVTIITDMLAQIFGFDKYTEVTAEYAIRGTYCDLATVVDGKLAYLIEVKAIGKKLRADHVRQATDYAAKEGIEWVVLTNGVHWQVYHMEFEQPVRAELSFKFDLLDSGKDICETIYTLTREGMGKRAIEEYHEQMEATDKYVLAALLLDDAVLSVVRREIRKMNPSVRVSTEEIAEIIKTQVIKRDVVEGEAIDAARRAMHKARKRAMRSKKTSRTKGASQEEKSVGPDTPPREQIPGS